MRETHYKAGFGKFLTFDEIFYLGEDKLLENSTCYATITGHDIVSEFVISLTACKITCSHCKLLNLQCGKPLGSTLRRCDEKNWMSLLPAQKAGEYFKDTPSSLSVRSVARLGTKFGV